MTAYPGALDALNDPAGSTPLNSSSTGLSHSIQHTNVNAAIEAIQAALGTLPAGAYGSVRARMEAVDTNLSTGNHVHATSKITGLDAALTGKAASVHTHAEADVTSLVADLAAKAIVSTATTPSPLGVAAIGTSVQAARADHVHLVPTLATLGAAATATTISAGSGLTGGGDLSANRTLAANFATSGGDGGTGVTVARGDHIHDGRYFTETEADTRYATAGHNHNGVYAKVTALATGTALPSAAGYSEGDIIAFY